MNPIQREEEGKKSQHIAERWAEPRGPGEGEEGRFVPFYMYGTGIQQLDIGVCKM